MQLSLYEILHYTRVVAEELTDGGVMQYVMQQRKLFRVREVKRGSYAVQKERKKLCSGEAMHRVMRRGSFAMVPCTDEKNTVKVMHDIWMLCGEKIMQ